MANMGADEGPDRSMQPYTQIELHDEYDIEDGIKPRAQKSRHGSNALGNIL